MNPNNPNLRKKPTPKQRPKQKVYIILVFNANGTSKVLYVYAHEDKALERLDHLHNQFKNSVNAGLLSFHLIKKSIQGRVDG